VKAGGPEAGLAGAGLEGDETSRPRVPFDAWKSPDRTETTLADGSRIVVLPVGPGVYDHALLRHELQAHFTDLSEESRYRRFLAAMPLLSPSMLHQLVDTVDDVDHVALFAQVIPGGRPAPQSGRPLIGIPIGIGRFIRDPDRPNSADVAVTVIDAWQHNGVGSLIISALARSARRHGIDVFVADVLATNPAALALLKYAGDATRTASEAGVIHAEVKLGEHD
jgi:GNAT superfamily N-acetyltransferase